MAFELSDVKKVLDAFQEGAWDRIHLRDDDSELLLSIHDESDLVAADVASVPAASVSAPDGSAVAVMSAPVTAPPTVTPVAATGPIVDSVTVCANSMGIFWRSPSPGAPPFVVIGDTIAEDTTVCIVEVMKLMHRTVAGVRGVVQEALVQNGMPVQAGQPLFRVAALPA